MPAKDEPTTQVDRLAEFSAVAAPPVTIQQSEPPVESTRPVAPSMPKVVGGYEIRGILGRGGMGVVYRAFDPTLKRTVALKMLTAGADATAFDLSRFRDEADIIAQLQHPNIVQIHQVGQHEDCPFLVLELVEGGTLAGHLDNKPQKPMVAAGQIETLARAVHAAHVLGIVHRDLKPANVLMSASGHLKLTDFGLAKQLGGSIGRTRTGELMGTPSYMAPEQASGDIKAVSEATDVYALGVILYEMLTGRPPFRGADMLATLEQVRTAEPASPTRLVPKLPRDLVTICLKCLEKPPERRYPTALHLADDLNRFVNGLPIVARPVGGFEHALRWVRRHPVATGLAACSVVAMLALGVAADKARQARADQIRREDSERLGARIDSQYQQSKKALDRILALLLLDDGELKRQKGLDPLYRELIGYYEMLVKQRDGATAAERSDLAASFVKIGKLTAKTGQKPASLAAFLRATDLLAANAEADPRDLLESALARLEIGKLRSSFGEYDKAAADYDGAEATLTELSTAQPGKPEFRKQRAEVLHERGSLLNARGKKEEALAAYNAALSDRRKLADAYPNDDDNRRGLGRSHGFIGDVEMDMGRLGDADRSYWESLRKRKEVSENRKGDLEAQFQLARGYANLGDLHSRVRAFDTAIHFYGEAMKIREVIVKAEPANADFRSDSAQVSLSVAELHIMRGRPSAAVPLLDIARGHYADLQAAAPNDTGVRGSLAETNLYYAVATLDDAATAVKARETLESASAALETLRDQRGDAGTWYNLACARSLASAKADALAALKKALAMKYRGKHPIDVRSARAFKSLHGDAEFQSLLDQYEKDWSKAVPSQ